MYEYEEELEVIIKSAGSASEATADSSGTEQFGSVSTSLSRFAEESTDAVDSGVELLIEY